MTAGRAAPFNPGACWVTRLAFEPRVAVAALMAMLRPQVDAGSPHAASARPRPSRPKSRMIASRKCARPRDGRICFRPAWSSTPPSSATCCRCAAPSTWSARRPIAETGEPHAQPAEPKPHCVQSFTYTFALRAPRQGRKPRHPAPEKYEHYRAAQPYSLTHRGPRRRDLRRDERLAAYGLYDTARHQGRPVDLPPPGRRAAFDSALSPRPHDVQLAGQRLPGSQHPRSARRCSRGGAAGRQARQPRLPPLAADRGAGAASGSARRSSCCGPT